MRRINSRLTINGKVLPFFSEIEIKDGRNDFTATAKIKIPNRISKRGKKITDQIELGSPVQIELGYYPNLFLQFEGYVSQLVPEKTAEIICENEAYIYKRKNIGKDLVLKNTNTNKLVPMIYDGFADVADINIGDWKISKSSTLIEVLAELQSKYKIYSYFRGKTLVVGASADTMHKKEIKAHFQENIPAGESEYNFKDTEADRIATKTSTVGRDGKVQNTYAYYEGTPQKITYSSTEPNNYTINEMTIGGQSGLTEEDRRDLGRIRLEALTFTGVDGKITLYGRDADNYPVHGDIANVTDLEIPEKNGKFAIVETLTKVSKENGIRTEITLGVSV